MKIPLWRGKRTRVYLKIELIRMIPLSEAQAGGYVRTSCEAAGYEIITSTPATKGVSDEAKDERS